MRARRAEYCRSVASSATVVTYNVALQPPTPKAVAALRPLLRPPPRCAGRGVRFGGLFGLGFTYVASVRVKKY
jgi:hypothetical protein